MRKIEKANATKVMFLDRITKEQKEIKRANDSEYYKKKIKYRKLLRLKERSKSKEKIGKRHQ